MPSPENAAPWPKMRADSRNTACRIFQWIPQPKKQVRYIDSTAGGQLPLSLINATPIIGPDETIYAGSSNLYFYAWKDDGTLCIYTDKNDLTKTNIVDSAACLVSDSELFFPCGNYSLYLVPTPPGNCQRLTDRIHVIDIRAGRLSLNDYGKSTPSTIRWLEGNVVDDGSGNLLAGCDNFFLFSYNPAEKKLKWEFPTGFFIWSACSFSPDQKALYFLSADMNCYALDPRTGEELWEQPVGNLSTSSPAVTKDNRVIFGSFDGKIYCLDGNKKGKELWSHPTGSLIYASPALSDQDNRIFIMSSDGVLRALDVGGSKPKVLWEFFTGMPAFSSAAIGLDPAAKGPYLIYVGSGDGFVYALDPSGRRRWSYDIAAFYKEQSLEEPSDPAFWPAFRYPAINSSVALGNKGVVTATSGGYLLSIPYNGYDDSANAFFNTSPQDNYVEQLLSAGANRLCYVSPAGRMAKDLLPTQPGATIPVYAGQTLTFTDLSLTSNGDSQQRSSFSKFPSGIQVLVAGQHWDQWKLSADKTQIHIAPPPPNRAQQGFQLQVNDKQGKSVAAAQCLYRPGQNPASREDALKAELKVQQMSFFSPFVVPALDQLAIATLTIFFKFLSIDPVTGAAVAYGYESYESDIKGAPTRNLTYIFRGWYADGNFRLSSDPCYYELTAFPVLLDTLTISGALSGTGSKEAQLAAASLTAFYQNTLFKQAEWLQTYVSRWMGPVQFPDWSDLWKHFSLEALWKFLKELASAAQPSTYSRFAIFLLRVLGSEFLELFSRSSVFAPWKLFDENDSFFWAGSYSLKPAKAVTAPTSDSRSHEARFEYDSWTGQLKVTVTECKEDDVVGIILFDQNNQPVNLTDDGSYNYTDRLSNQVYNAADGTITQKLSLWATFFSPWKKLRAVAMVNLTGATPKYDFSPWLKLWP